jgi:gamma-glutamyltranspeptidase
MRRRSVIVLLAALSVLAASSAVFSFQSTQAQTAADSTAIPAGVREAAWSPDSKRLVVSRFGALWTMAPDGRDAKRVITKPGDWIAERDPAWSADGKTIAFSASANGQFDLWTVPASGGTATRLTSMPGDERWPSWTRDGRVVYSHREPRGVWKLYLASATSSGSPVLLTSDDVAEWQGRVSPDGKRIVLISDRDLQGNDDTDVWVRTLPESGAAAGAPIRVTNAPGAEFAPVWAPDNARVAYAAIRAGGQNGVWVSVVSDVDAQPAGGGGRAGGGRGRGAAPGGPPAGAPPPSTQSAVMASRRVGIPAWSPDSHTLVIATFPTGSAGYNGNPNRNDDDPPIAMAEANQYELWRVAAPRAIDEDATSLTLPAPEASRWVTAFDEVWQTMRSLYYPSGPSAGAWDALRAKYRTQAAQAKDAKATEDVIDRMIAEEPLIKPALESKRAVVASAHPLASQAGALVLEKGGNVIDAGIAVAFALGVVEPEASSIGGDGQAILFLKGMKQPVVVEYKDMTPGHATADNPRLFNGTTRTASDGPTVANIPGIVAGLDLLYQKYGSKKVEWADLVAPAIKLADEGFVLDEALPTSIAEGRASFAKYPESAKLFLPNGRVPRAGERFVNKDYAETLRTLAKEGGQSFYRGSIAQKIAADMAANGGIITIEDLNQYRAMEREPISGKFHGHMVYSVPAPVSTGAQIVETLNILDQYQPKAGATIATDADYLHYAIEAWRVRDGGGRIADPERFPVDYGNHLEPAHAAERFKLIDPKKVYTAQGGRGAGPPAPAFEVFQTEDETGRVQTGTTAFVVADAEGNMIAFTQTLSTWGGNYYVSKGLGFLYNDHFRGGGRGMLPLVRSSSTSVPTLVFGPSPAGAANSGVAGYSPKIAVGCAGNAWIPASVYNVILNVVDGGLSAQRAIEGPRMLIGGGAGGRSNVQIEDRIPRTLLADLEARGHSFTKVGRKGEVKYGYAAVAVVDAAGGSVQGGADPRRSHGTAAPGAVSASIK